MSMAQQDMIEKFEALGRGAWTTVYDSWRQGSVNGAVYSAFAPPEERRRVVGDSSWDVTIGASRSGFSRSRGKNDEWITTYLPGGIVNGLEPLVLVREFHGAVPSMLELQQDFRLYHNLYWDPLTSQHMQPHDDGTSSVAVKMTDRQVQVRTKLLRQYQAARQLDLAFYIDSVCYGDDGEVLPERQEWSTDDLHADLFPGDGDGPQFTRYLGSRVLVPPPIEKAGIWPYEQPDEYFPDFIVGVDADGDEIGHTCNPDALDNYFGANAGAPHYLTPVHFRRDVLQKYYEKPELYTVHDGRLTCAALWSVQIDNSAEDGIVVFLGDLGRDLPRQERDYWRSFNVVPDGNVSETMFRRSFLAQAVEPTAKDLRVRAKYVSFAGSWEDRYGWDLFRKPEEADAGLLQRLRLPLNDSQAEFEASIRIMTQLFVDAINEQDLQKTLGERVPHEKGISKLARWLRQAEYPHVDRDIQFLRNLQELRSKATAHRKESDYELTLTKVFGAVRGPAAVRTLFESALVMLISLEEWVATTANGR